ncbi:MAG: TrpR like protein, YerC/YecD [Candidatus Magasanikbacteria bacterium]|nr:TrpR like protein, YerC/YecD [Candidatus Magasanikbacteria bacterium]
MKSWKTQKLKQMAKALLSLKTEKEALAFLRDVATLEELESLSSRWNVVLELNKNTSYRDIAKKTGVSTATITRISHWLKHGEGGYQTALKKLKKS